ncbi:MAG: hypothetical protein ABIZ70_02635 [Gemmatimonadales bacterium]
MLARVARRTLRVAGWLLTPIVLTITAIIGATIGAMVAPRFSPTGGLLVTAIAGLIGACLGLVVWEKILGRSPELRAALALTAEGIPEPAVVEEMVTLHPDTPDSGAP